MMRQRGREKAWNEFMAYSEGICLLYGALTYKHVYSVARLLFRLMPTGIIRLVYNGRLRRAVVRT